jgi:catechol 2,3-dioxygenase-like lactoylglutathione lyase family enzyme
MTCRHILTILAVEDLGRAVRFYELAFGWPRVVDVPTYVEMEFPGGARIGLYDRQGFGRNIGRAPPRVPAGELAPAELYFFVDDMDVALDRLRTAGARELSPLAPRDWGHEVAYVADPDGFVLALARPLSPVG